MKFTSVHILGVLHDWSLICLTMVSLDIYYKEFCYSPKMKCFSPFAFHQLNRICGSRNHPYLQEGWLISLYPSPPGISSLASYFAFGYWDPPLLTLSKIPMTTLGEGMDIFWICPEKKRGGREEEEAEFTPYSGLYGEAPPKRGTCIWKGRDFMSRSIKKGRETCHLGI